MFQTLMLLCLVYAVAWPGIHHLRRRAAIRKSTLRLLTKSSF